MMRVLRALPPQFALIVPATVILYLVSPLLAEGSVSGSSILIVFSFASILAIAIRTATIPLWCPGLLSRSRAVFCPD
jgi:ribose transport system permease protein